MLSITCHNWTGFLRKDGCSNLDTWIVMMMMMMMMMTMTILPVMAMVSCGNQNLTRHISRSVNIMQQIYFNFQQIFQHIISAYDMRPHQLSMLNVLSTESAVKPRCPAVVTGTAPGTHDDLIAGKWNPGVFFGGVQCVAAQVHI